MDQKKMHYGEREFCHCGNGDFHSKEANNIKERQCLRKGLRFLLYQNLVNMLPWVEWSPFNPTRTEWKQTWIDGIIYAETHHDLNLDPIYSTFRALAWKFDELTNRWTSTRKFVNFLEHGVKINPYLNSGCHIQKTKINRSMKVASPLIASSYWSWISSNIYLKQLRNLILFSPAGSQWVMVVINVRLK